jgi:hypothetical protein
MAPAEVSGALWKRDNQNYWRLDVQKFNEFRKENAEAINNLRKDGKECIKCNRIFDDDYNFQRHVVSLHLCPRPSLLAVRTDPKPEQPSEAVKKVKEAKSFECEICKKKFLRFRQLGGHMSRSHPKQSEKYRQKMETRERRTTERECQQQAKAEIQEKYEGQVGMHLQSLLYVATRDRKKELMRERGLAASNKL